MKEFGKKKLRNFIFDDKKCVWYICVKREMHEA